MAALQKFRGFMARFFLIVGALALVWAIVLALAGGFEAELFGRRLRTHEPLRPFFVAALALAAFVPLYGAARAHALWLRATRRLDEGPAAIGLAVFILVVGAAYNSTAAAGSDPYGYVSQADLWLTGDLQVAQPWSTQVPWPTKGWSFAPLGYRPLDDARQDRLVPTYSVGLPLLMAGATLVGGRGAAFLVVPIAGAVLVYMTYALGRRLGSRRAGLIGAWFVATSPAVLMMLMFPMTDVPVAAAWTSAFYFALGSSWRSAAAAGLASGAAVLIRPNLVPLAAVVGLLYVVRGWRRGVPLAAVYSAGALLGVATTAAVNARLYGSPFASGYGDVAPLFRWSNVVPNIRLYAGWLLEMQTPLVLAGAAAVFVPLRRFWPGAAERSVFVVAALFVVTVFAEYVAYVQFDSWTYLRFLLPSWPLIMVGMGAVALAVARAAPPGRVLAAAGVVICLGVYEYRLAARAGAFDVWRSERASVLVARRVRDLTDPNSVILSMNHSGSVRYYAGRMTMRFDILDADWLDRGVVWLAEHGAHPYLLVNDWELPQFRARFKTQATAGVVDGPPMLAYQGLGRILLFDLLPGRGAGRAVAISDTSEDLRSAEPATPARFILQ